MIKFYSTKLTEGQYGGGGAYQYMITPLIIAVIDNYLIYFLHKSL